ncbi:MAG: hypothetical protein QOH25_1590 [Acidobacteriota bacterium]|nr:hypothetical protein [Acidobacteriota bacterium]
MDGDEVQSEQQVKTFDCLNGILFNARAVVRHQSREDALACFILRRQSEVQRASVSFREKLKALLRIGAGFVQRFNEVIKGRTRAGLKLQ